MDYIKNINGYNVIVDDEGMELLNKYSWKVRKFGNKLYLRASIRMNGKKKDASFHRLIANTPNGLHTDHINGNSLDNRKCNLRVVTAAINNQNLVKAKRDNKCGLLGANWHKRVKKWRAQIRLNKKTIHIGYFDTAIEAHNAYLQRKREIHSGCTI